MERPLSYAYSRPWAFSELIDLKRFPALFAARAYSCSKMADIAAVLKTRLNAVPMLETVALVGSLGRLEAHRDSDFDVVGIINNESDPHGEAARAAMDVLFAALAGTGFREPKAWGIYRTPTSERELCDPAALGSLSETPNVFGKRIQLLLDAQPVYRHGSFRELQRSVLEWYATGFLAHDPSAEWVYLLNDLMRYFRSYAAWQQFDLKHEPTSSWYARIAKLQHSRTLTYAALLLLLGECSGERADKIGWLAGKLSLTPLERIAFVYQQAGDAGLESLLAAYERFAEVWNDPAARQFLLVEGPRTVADLPPRPTPVSRDLEESAMAIKDELIRFILARRAAWSRDFFRFLWF